ncbi:ATP-binding cassette domain-containing protein [Shigella flexneri]
MPKAIVGLETYEQGRIVINGEKMMRPDYGDMPNAASAIRQKTAKKRGLFPGWALTKYSADQSAKNQHQRCAATASTIRRLTEEVMQRMTVKAASRRNTPSARFSGGNQQKVVIGRWVYAASQISLLDEPTRGVEIQAKTADLPYCP